MEVRFGLGMTLAMRERLFDEAQRQGLTSASYVRNLISRQFEALDARRAGHA